MSYEESCWICRRTDEEIKTLLGGEPFYSTKKEGLAEIYMDNIEEIGTFEKRTKSKYHLYVCPVCAHLLTKAALDIANYVDDQLTNYVRKDKPLIMNIVAEKDAEELE